MSKSYPEGIVLKSHKCPTCGAEIAAPSLRRIENAVKAACHNDKCDYAVDLFWLGDAALHAN
jgi:hypothetical protein